MTEDLLADPETDPRATYVVDHGLARRLTARVVCAPVPETVLTHTPMTGAPLALLPQSTPDDVTAAYASARSAQRSWSRTPIPQRARIFLRFHDLVLERQAELLDFMQLETGKARMHGFEEIADTAMVSRHYARRAAGYLRPHRRPGAFPLISRPVELRHPKGVVGIVAPWNYSLSMSITDAIPALLAGNAVVLRPDNQSALTALAAVALLYEAGLPEGVLQVVLGDGPTVGGAVLELADYVCFTGSTATGLLCHGSPGRGGPGEADVVRELEHRPADRRAVAEHDLKQAPGQPRLVEQGHSRQSGQGTLVVRPEHHRIAGQQRRDRVGDRHRQRVVPGGDDAHHALGLAQLDRLAEQRESPLSTARTQVSRRATRIVTAHDRGVRDLLEAVRPSLAGLELDEVEQLHLPLEHKVVEPQEDPGSLRHRRA